MIYSQISQLLSGGHSPDELIALLAKNAPKLKKEIGTLIASGWGADAILKRVSKMPGAKNLDFRKFEPISPDERASHLVQQGRSEQAATPEAQRFETAKGAGKAALGAGLGLAGASLLPAALSRAAPALAGLAGRPASSIGSAAAPTAAAAPAITEALTPKIGSAITTAAGATAPVVRKTAKDILQNLGLLGIAKNSKGVDPKALKTYIETLHKDAAKAAKDQGIDLEQVFADYFAQPEEATAEEAQETALTPEEIIEQTTPQVSDNQYAGGGKPIEENPKIGISAPELPINAGTSINGPTMAPEPVKPKPEPEEPAKPEPGKDVILPDGDVGEIEEVDPNGKYVTVNVNGKRRRVKFEDVEVEPENLVEFMHTVAAIPESERSRMIAYFGYQPKTKTLAVQFHNGEYYNFHDVDEEDIKPVANASGTAKTTGKDEYGEHIAGVPDSRGAALIERIISNPKYARPKKGEQENPNYEKFEKIYDYWEKLRRKTKRKKAVT